MANYRRIVGNWAANARAGRNRANQAVQNEMKALEMEQKANLLEQQNAQATQQHIANINAQAEQVAKFARPKDLEIMKTVESDATAEIKSQLEAYGDDITAFMRGGGMQHLKNYRDAVLNSDEAKTIRQNHKAITQYLDVANKTPMLVSRIDRQGFEDWQSGKNNAFIFHGQYLPYDKEGLEVDNYSSIGEAYLNHKDNINAAMFNYNLDNNINAAHVSHGGNVTDDMLINYLNTTLGGQDSAQAFKDRERITKANSAKASEQLKIINGQIDRGFQGDFTYFWESGSNATAFENLKQRTGAGTFAQIGENNVYGTRMFVGQEKDFAASLFGVDKKSLGDDMKIDVNTVNNLLQTGGVKFYDQDGKEKPLGSTLGFGYDDDMEILGFQYGLKVNDDLEKGTSKLLTFDDANDDSESSLRNRAKDGVVTLMLREPDRGLSDLFRGKDDYIYIELDMNNASIAKKLDDAVGDMEYKSKQAAEVTPGQYVYEPGKRFSFSGDNARQATSSLHAPTQEAFKKIGIQEPDTLMLSTVIAHSLQMQQDNMSPDDFLQVLTTNDTTTPEGKIMQQALQELREGDRIGYINVFKDNNIITKAEANKLDRDINAILNGYRLLGEEFDSYTK